MKRFTTFPEVLEAVFRSTPKSPPFGVWSQPAVSSPRKLVRSTEAQAPLRPAEETSPGDFPAIQC